MSPALVRSSIFDRHIPRQVFLMKVAAFQGSLTSASQWLVVTKFKKFKVNF